ncbi:hypothetical protein LTR64_003481 [Lithohypha guttulata]|uniref:uncharacterized protein n=1 Tax=Lithohypha guttulata TaxID=1690604 RepID=UPI00315C4DBC
MDDEPTSITRQQPELLAYAQVPFEGTRNGRTQDPNNYFKAAEWSPDGTCIIANCADNHIRNFVVPPDLLEQRDETLKLEVYCSIPSFESVNTFACYPGFNLQDPSTTLVLSAASEHPLRLNSMMTGQLVASYPLVSATTEAYLKPHSLLFTADGNQLIAGSENLISRFDISRPGEGPISSMKTGPKNARSSWSNPGTSLRGFVSALHIDPQYNVLAAGTLTRQVGLYDAAGEGECVGVFGLSGTEANDLVSGNGVTQVRWSRCGRYLYVAERHSDGALVYDIRKTGQLLSWLIQRKARTNQRMHIELSCRNEDNESVWAGGTDGKMRCWAAPHLREGEVAPDQEMQVHEDSANSTSMHRSAYVLATAAGERDFDDLGNAVHTPNKKLSVQRNLLKLWQLSFTARSAYG